MIFYAEFGKLIVFMPRVLQLLQTHFCVGEIFED